MQMMAHTIENRAAKGPTGRRLVFESDFVVSYHPDSCRLEFVIFVGICVTPPEFGADFVRDPRIRIDVGGPAANLLDHSDFVTGRVYYRLSLVLVADRCSRHCIPLLRRDWLCYRGGILTANNISYCYPQLTVQLQLTGPSKRSGRRLHVSGYERGFVEIVGGYKQYR